MWSKECRLRRLHARPFELVSGEGIMVSPGEYLRFKADYMSTSIYEHQRFGQAFCNCFNVTDPDLFYARKMEEAIEMIKTKYVKESK
jgi:hypothetical protein